MDIKDVENYLNNINRETGDERLVNPKVHQDIKELLAKASKVTNLPISDLLLRLDFKSNDQTIEALESFLAEIRSIFWLRDFGFKNIVPLQAAAISQPDFTANFSGQDCTIEVFCLTEKHEQQKDRTLNVYVNFDPNFNGSKFGRDFMSNANRKKVQLDSHSAKTKILLCVINSNPVIRLNTANEINAHAKFLYNKLNWGNNYYIGILTGVVVNGQSSNTIYPLLLTYAN